MKRNIIGTEDILPRRMAWGQGICGPDFPGCINSGREHSIWKSHAAEKYVGKPFVVCFKMGWSIMKQEVLCEMLARGKRPTCKEYRVRFFKTYAAARREFTRRSAERRQEIEKRVSRSKPRPEINSPPEVAFGVHVRVIPSGR